MDFNQEQINELKKVFDQIDVKKEGVINEEGIKNRLLEFEIDDSFAPALSRIFRRNEGIRFEDLLEFLRVLISGNTMKFFQVLFSGIDNDNDKALGLNDLTSFGHIVGEELTDEEAREIMKQCDYNGDGTVNFSDFWKWYKQQHGITDEN